MFEMSIRFLGGLLSSYAITGTSCSISSRSDCVLLDEIMGNDVGDERLKQQAYDLGQRLLPAFDTSLGIPSALVNLVTYVSLCPSVPTTLGLSYSHAAAAAAASLLLRRLHLHDTLAPTRDPALSQRTFVNDIHDVIL